MCGISGIVHIERSRSVDPELLRAMTDVMKHRGPDDRGEYLAGNVGFGHRRLSIIDLSRGHQPLSNEDSSIWIVFNGEIYNFPDLYRELQSKGHTFKTQCDTEAIVHAYEEWGTDCVRHLRGMFAFALHDQRNDLVFAARDRLGIKPFYYHFDEKSFVFASEIKPLLYSGCVTPGVDFEAVESFVSVGYVPGPKSLFDGIAKLQPAHYLVLRNGHLKIRRYWDFNDVPVSTAPDADQLKQLDEKLSESVKIHLLSDVPLGVFLSGGLDSSAIVALMAQASPNQVKTFAVGYEDAPEISELAYARQVATQYRTEHHEFILKPGNFLETLESMTSMFAEPVVEAPGIALYHIAKCAKADVTVALSGEGSDEMFAGYRLYDTFLKLKKLQGVTGMLAPLLRRLQSHTASEKFRKYIDWLTSDIDIAYRGTSYDVTQGVRSSIFNDDFIHSNGAYMADIFHEHFRRVTYRDTVGQLQYVDAQTWMVDDILTKSDRMTMAASIECRVPFLDHEVVELAASLPRNLKIRNGVGKYCVKKVMEPRLPREIIYRPKRGFPVPLRKWFQEELFAQAESMITSSKFRNRGYFNNKYIDKILQDHKRGTEDFSRRILTFFIFELWHQNFIDAAPSFRAAAPQPVVL
jgi:asparagine synthase (glutamine-hydrolysing)